MYTAWSVLEFICISNATKQSSSSEVTCLQNRNTLCYAIFELDNLCKGILCSKYCHICFKFRAFSFKNHQTLFYTRFYKFNCVTHINLCSLFNKSLSSICNVIRFIAEWGTTKQLQSIPAIPLTTLPESLWHTSLSFQLIRF